MSRLTEGALALAPSCVACAALVALAAAACEPVAPPPIGSDAEDATTATHDTHPSSDTRTADDAQAVDAAPSLASDPLWDPRHLPSFHLTFAAANWQKSLWDLLPSDPCVRRDYADATVVFDNPQTGQSEVYAHVGARWRGHSSLDITDPVWQRPGIKLSFDEFEPGRRFQGLKKLNFSGTENDYSLMHETQALGVARQLGMAAPRANYAHLWVNDAYLGLYPLIQEGDDDPFLEQEFAGDDHGALFDVEWSCGTVGQFSESGTASELAEVYEPKAHTEVDAITDVIMPIIACTSIVDDDTFRQCIEPLVDVDQVLGEIAFEVATANPDGFFGTAQNYRLYRPTTTGRLVVIPWDLDHAFSEDLLANPTDFGTLTPTWATSEPPRNALAGHLLRAYPRRYCEALDRVLRLVDPVVLLPELDAQRMFLRSGIEGDPFMDLTAWLQAYLAIEHTVTHRYAGLRPLVDRCLTEGVSPF